MTSINLPAGFETASRRIFNKEPEIVLEELMASELRRKLIEYRIVDERFRQEYGMGFDEFKKKNIVGRQKHSFNVESDFCDWELAVDGIGTINKELKRILK